ncbi:MAG: hypothetical protein GX106_08030 [Candidatus Cloacimonetes bacterium]|nr:hypothetical protein [Candidatus Cloacimonadota bacterium]
MENSKLVVKLEFKGKEELQQLITQIGKKYDIPVDIDLSKVKLGVFKEFKNNFHELYTSARLFTTQTGLAIQGIKQMYSVLQQAIGPFIKTSSEFEQLRLRLFNLYQDTDRATAAFEKFRKVALETPATLREVVEAGANLKAFGLDAEDVLENVQDLAAFMGINVVEAANAVGRAFAGGAGAAIMLRDRGILELIRSFHGIDDLSKLTLPEFREAMLSTFKSTETGIAGSSARMADSYAGAMAQMQDAMETLYAAVGDRFTPAIAGAARVLTRFIEKLAGAKSGVEAVKASLTSQRVEFERLVMVYKDLHHNQNRSTEDNIKYQKTINDLMNKYPNYLGKIDLEKGAWNEVERAINLARDSLQKWIHVKIKEAVIDSRKDQMAQLLAKEATDQLELETLRAEFELGKKSRTRKQLVTEYDMFGNKTGLGTMEVASKHALREEKLDLQIRKYKTQYSELNEEIERIVKLMAGEDVSAPGGEGGGEGGSRGPGGTGLSEAEIDSIMREIEAYRVLREANYNEELAQIETLKQEYSLKLKAVAVAPRTGGFAAGGHVGSAAERVRDVQMNVVLKCDGKELARAVARGNKKIIST